MTPYMGPVTDQSILQFTVISMGLLVMSVYPGSFMNTPFVNTVAGAMVNTTPWFNH